MSRWNLIRLELDRTPDFPEGSACRAYMLCLPLDADGVMDEAALALQPLMATARRFWPNEADRFGHVVRQEDGWAISFEPGKIDNGGLVHLESRPVRPGGCLALRTPDGQVDPFRVVHMQPDGCAEV